MLYENIQESIKFIQKKVSFQAQFGIILGTGLSKLSEEIEVAARISYEDIPHFNSSTVQSHKGELIFGTLAGKAVVAMAGRFHYYEGYSMKEVTFPVRVLKFLGIKNLISLGPRFPDMLDTYDRGLNAKALAIAKAHHISAHEGVYLALQGPNLETPAEYNFIHQAGADVVGMSTVPEVLVAKQMDLPVFVISVISNKCYPLEILTKTTVEEVIEVVETAAPKMGLLVKEILQIL